MTEKEHSKPSVTIIRQMSGEGEDRGEHGWMGKAEKRRGMD